MTAPKFPDEPIRTTGDPMTNGVYWRTDPQPDGDYEGDPDARSCMSCGGEGFKECDGDCNQSDDCGCPYARGHLITCTNCRGSGDAKDQTWW